VADASLGIVTTFGFMGWTGSLVGAMRRVRGDRRWDRVLVAGAC
jgi:hypothetical protein